MNISEKIKDLKKFFFSEEPQTPLADTATPPAEPVKQEATEYQTKDGKVVYIDKLEEGGIVTSDNVPVDDGNYTLVDGTSFTTELGVIKSITLATPAPAPVVDEEMKKQLATMQAKFAAIEAKENKEVADLKAKVAKQNEALKEMFAIVDAMGEIASDKPLEQTKDWNKLSSLEKFRLTKQN